jgi:hypothetical protein
MGEHLADIVGASGGDRTNPRPCIVINLDLLFKLRSAVTSLIGSPFASKVSSPMIEVGTVSQDF